MSDRESHQRHSSQISGSSQAPRPGGPGSARPGSRGQKAGQSAKGQNSAAQGRQGAGAPGPGSEEQWRSMEREFGLFTISEVAQRLGFGYGPNARAQRLAGKAPALAVRRGNGFRYPGFQFDEPGGRMIPVVKDIVRAARSAGWTDEQTTLWFCAPNRQLHGKRPVDLLDNEEQLISAADADIPQSAPASGRA